MTRIRNVIGIVLASVIALAHRTPGQGGGETAADQKLLASEAKRLVPEAFSGDAKKAETARARLARTRPEDRKPVFDTLAAMPWRPPPGNKATKDRRVTETIDVPESTVKKAPVVFEVPSKYDGKTPVPVLFRFHGSGDSAADFSRSDGGNPALSKFLRVTPEVPSEKRTAYGEPGGRALVDRAWKHLLVHYCVDPDRVYFSGYSAGGAASFFLAQSWPHRVAGFYAMSRLHWNFHLKPEPCMDVLAHVPGFFVVGLSDTEERVSGYRSAEAYYQKTNLPGVFHFVKNKGHEYMAEFDKPALEHLGKAPRRRYPKEFRTMFFQYGDAAGDRPFIRRQYWLEGDEYSHNGTPCRVAVQGNTVAIEAPELKAGSLLLNDQILDLDQPVVVTLDGKEVHHGPVERSIPFLLAWFDANPDRGDLYWNRVAFKR